MRKVEQNIIIAKLNKFEIITETLSQKKSNRRKYTLDFSMFESKDTYSITHNKLRIN